MTVEEIDSVFEPESKAVENARCILYLALKNARDGAMFYNKDTKRIVCKVGGEWKNLVTEETEIKNIENNMKKESLTSLNNNGCKRIVLVDAPGQTCNRFWAYLDSVAWAIANNRKVVILHWDSSIQYYDALRKNTHVSFPFYLQNAISVIGERSWKCLLLRFFNNRITNRFYRTNLAHRIGFFQSWPLRKSHDYFPKLKEKLKPIFRPNEDICMHVENTMKKYKSEGYFVIGVHIRRGDYKNWEGGRYFYELSDYADTMRSLTLLYKDKQVAFFISTNEQYDEKVFSGLTLCRFNNKTAAHDLHTLSLCDRIIGPLSTFSRWASWYGDVPLAFIEKEQIDMKESDFSIIHDFYHFDNGNEIVNLSDKVQTL